MRRTMAVSKRTWMCAGPVVMVVADAALTLVGQAPEYWLDGYSAVREDNAIGHWLLELHPVAFLLGVVLWTVLFAAAIHRLPIGWARVLAFGVMFGHAFGAATWLLRWPFGLLAVLGILLLARALDTLIWDSCDDRAEDGARPDNGERPTGNTQDLDCIPHREAANCAGVEDGLESDSSFSSSPNG